MKGQVIGIDIGGSKTHAALADDTQVLAEVIVGGANISSLGPAEAATQLAAAVGRLNGTDVRAVCAGASGADTPEARDQVTALLASIVPGAQVAVVHDAHLLLATAALDAGIALIAGTGSIAWGITPEGRSRRAGGWGYLLGDEGSGFGIARAAVQHVLGRLDRGEAPDRLTVALVESCGLSGPDRLLERFYADPSRQYWAKKADVVFELADGGDPAAVGLVDAAAAALYQLVRTVADTLPSDGPVVCAGGVFTHRELLRDGVRRRLHDLGITDIQVLDRAPVHGAVHLARRSIEGVR